MASHDYLRPIERAFDGLGKALFSPFDFNVWFKLGFVAWLACLFEGPASISSFFNLPSDFANSSGKGGSPFQNWHPSYAEIMAIAAIAAAVIIVFIAISLIALWVKSRGKFMFIDALAKGVDDASIPERWSKFKPHGNSLFGFQICWSIAVLIVLAIPLGGSAGLFLWAIFKGGGVESLLQHPLLLAGIAVLLLAFIFLAIAASALQTIILDFGTLHMYKNGSSAWTAAWKSAKLVKQRPVQMLVYILTLIGISMAIGAMLLCLMIAMCFLCCSCLLFYIPYIWAVILLPFLAFRRLFTIESGFNAGEEFTIATQSSQDAKSQEPV